MKNKRTILISIFIALPIFLALAFIFFEGRNTKSKDTVEDEVPISYTVSYPETQTSEAIVQTQEEIPVVEADPGCGPQIYYNPKYPSFSFTYNSCITTLFEEDGEYNTADGISATLLTLTDSNQNKLRFYFANSLFWGCGGPSMCYKTEYTSINDKIIRIKHDNLDGAVGLSPATKKYISDSLNVHSYILGYAWGQNNVPVAYYSGVDESNATYCTIACSLVTDILDSAISPDATSSSSKNLANTNVNLSIFVEGSNPDSIATFDEIVRSLQY